MENLSYSKVGEYNLPNLILPTEEDYVIGKYGRMRERYLKKYRRVMFINLLTSCELSKHLHDVNVRCYEMVSEIVNSLALKHNIDETFKSINQMEWVGYMNDFKQQAEEIVQNEIIYT